MMSNLNEAMDTLVEQQAKEIKELRQEVQKRVHPDDIAYILGDENTDGWDWEHAIISLKELVDECLVNNTKSLDIATLAGGK
jgi:hypothetical protein